MSRRVCFLGGARYSRPLVPGVRRKFETLAALGEIYVVGFAPGMRPMRFTEIGHFYLLPAPSRPLLRYLAMATGGLLLTFWIVLRHRVLAVVAQSPYEGFIGAVVKGGLGWLGLRVRLVVENHGDYESSLFLQREVRLPAAYRLAMRLTAGLALRRADALRAVSTSTHAQLQRSARGQPIVQFPAWIDLDVFLQAGEGAGASGANGPVLFAGVLIPQKAVHVLVEASARVLASGQEMTLVIIGAPANPAYVRHLRDLARDRGVAQRVTLLGPLPQEELAHHMARAAVLVLPSVSEGLGRVLLEAMAVGRPVIGTRVGGIPDLITEGENGFLVPPGDAEALADRIRWILRHPQEAAAMGRRGRDSARRASSPAGFVDGYRRLLADIPAHVPA